MISLLRFPKVLVAGLTGLLMLGHAAQAQTKKAPVPVRKPATTSKAPVKKPVAIKAPVKPAQPQGFSRTKSGIEYRIFRRSNGRYSLRTDVNPAGDPTYSTRIGKTLAAHMQYRTAKDSVLFSSRKQLGMAAQVPLAALQERGGIEEAVTLLQAGDSAVFRFNLDSVFTKSFRQPVPPFMRKAGNTLTMLVKAQKLMTPAEAQAEQQKMMELAQQKADAESAQFIAKDEVLIQEYMKKNNLTGVKTTGGTYYVVTKFGTGPKPQAGQTVSVLYTGMLLDGKVFDSSEKNGGQPITFPLGRGQVIRGWDQGLLELAQGTKAILLIPSPLAYGSRGAGADIPANAILRFDVELVDIKQ